MDIEIKLARLFKNLTEFMVYKHTDEFAAIRRLHFVTNSQAIVNLCEAYMRADDLGPVVGKTIKTNVIKSLNKIFKDIITTEEA